jgi:tetratricopeptide (TPR) repeat protein
VPTLLYHINLGTVYVGQRRFAEAEAEYRQALQIDPDAPQALTGLAVLHDMRGEPEQALEILTRLARAEGEAGVELLVTMAEIYVRLGRIDDGVGYLERLGAAPRPDGPPENGIGVALGLLYRAAGRRAEAEAVLLEALRRQPVSLTAMQELFALYDEQRRAAELEPLLRAALSIDSRLPMHHNWLGLVLQRREDYRAAEQEFRDTIEIAPELTGVMANLGGLYLRLGRVPEAVAILKQAVRQDPRNLESRTNLISALGREGDLDGARREVEEAEEMGQQAPQFYTALGYALHHGGRADEALAALRRALELDPQTAAARRLQAQIEAQRRPGGGER